MSNIKNRLLDFEEEFDKIKSKNDKYHLFFAAFYFLSSLVFVYFYNKFFSNNLTIKIVFFIFIICGLSAHYIMRYFFHKSKFRYKKFFLSVISDIKNNYKDTGNMENDIVLCVKEIFSSRNVSLDEKSLRYYPYWELLLLNLKTDKQRLK